MSATKSLQSRDTDGLLKHLGCNFIAQRAARHEIYAYAQEVFQEELQAHVPVERGRPVEVDKDVDVARAQ